MTTAVLEYTWLVDFENLHMMILEGRHKHTKVQAPTLAIAKDRAWAVCPDDFVGGLTHSKLLYMYVHLIGEKGSGF